MNARRGLTDRRWTLATYKRQLPEALAWAGLAVGFGVALAGTQPWWQAAVIACVVTFVLVIAWKAARLAAFRWRHTHAGPWVRQAPGLTGDAFLIGVCAWSWSTVRTPGWLHIAGWVCLSVLTIVIALGRWRRARGYSKRHGAA